MWKRSSASCHRTHLPRRERERAREKSAASAVWLQSSMREGEEGLVQHSSSKLRDCGGGQKGTCWPRTQVSFIHNRKHTHIRTQDEQQPFNSTRLAFATFYDFWFALSTFGVNYYFLLFVANKPLFLRLKAFFSKIWRIQNQHSSGIFILTWCWQNLGLSLMLDNHAKKVFPLL